MINIDDVYKLLISYNDTEGYPEKLLLSCAESGFNQINSRLKPGKGDISLALEAAAAVAHYKFILKTLSADKKYESYKVGDITVSADPSKALEREKAAMNQAIACASELLKDGGFFCCG